MGQFYEEIRIWTEVETDEERKEWDALKVMIQLLAFQLSEARDRRARAAQGGVREMLRIEVG